MGTSYTTIKNLSNEYKDYPTGCVPCPKGNKPGNPGTFEDIHKKFDDLEPKNFEGSKLEIKKILSNHFYAVHTLAMTPKSLSLLGEEKQDGYKFGASFIGTKRVGYKEKYPVVYGDITPNGNLTANFVHTLGCRFRIKLSTEVKKNKYKNLKATTEYRSDDLTISATLLDPLILKNEGVLLLQLLQSVTSRIALGAEIAYKKKSTPREEQINFACAVRYSTGFQTLSATFGQAGVRICCHHKQSHQLQMGVEFQANFITNKSKAKLLYHIDVPQADIICKGFIDTNWRVGAVFEKKLYPIPEASLILSCVIDHFEQDVCVGIGLNIG